METVVLYTDILMSKDDCMDAEGRTTQGTNSRHDAEFGLSPIILATAGIDVPGGSGLVTSTLSAGPVLCSGSPI